MSDRAATVCSALVFDRCARRGGCAHCESGAVLGASSMKLRSLATGAASFASSEVMAIRRYPRIAVVVPSLSEQGGVAAVADFIVSVIERSMLYEIKIISLATSSCDESSVLLRYPRTWGKVCTSNGFWNGRPFIHIGALLSDFEFMRYRHRSALSEQLENCDLIQLVCGNPAWALPLCGLGKPVVMSCATLAKVERQRALDVGATLQRYWRRGMAVVTDHLDRRALLNVDAIQTMNVWMSELAKELNMGRNVLLKFAPPGIDTLAFHPQSQRPLDTTGYILCVGRLSDPRKNITMLLDAYARLVKSISLPPQLLLVGSSGPNAVFWEKVHSFGLQDRITFRANPGKADLIKIYQGAACFALPSSEEGFGMVLIEAMACGVPVVATRCGGPDGIVTDGEDGFLISTDDAEAMADRLYRLLTDSNLNKNMGQFARSTIERRFSQSVTAKSFLEVYSMLLSK